MFNQYVLHVCEFCEIRLKAVSQVERLRKENKAIKDKVRTGLQAGH